MILFTTNMFVLTIKGVVLVFKMLLVYVFYNFSQNQMELQNVNVFILFTSRYELAAECADDDDAKHSINELRKAVSEELKMHASFVKVEGHRYFYL